jgi:hypothetical protein
MSVIISSDDLISGAQQGVARAWEAVGQFNQTAMNIEKIH